MLCLVAKIIFWISGFLIFWAMIGYKLSLNIIYKFKKEQNHIQQECNKTVTVMIVAHNEEKVIYEKLCNVIDNDYDADKIKYLVTSDNSTDKTNAIVEQFIREHSDKNITLYTTKEHNGKTNAQNEAQKLVDTEILIMTDANAMFEKNAISNLVASFTDENIAYVCGRLAYINEENETAGSESSYWEGDLKQRYIESSIKTITAGNGAIYACRNSEYITIPNIECHDSTMPYFYATHKKRAIYTPDAVAYEKAGESTDDEFKRKVRMNRILLKGIGRGLKVLNIFKYGWFSYFYFGHRTCRYLLWISHLLVFISNACLVQENVFYMVCFIGQVLFYLLALLKKLFHINNKYINLIAYYCMTIFAQWVAVKNSILGKSKAIWDKAESTR